MSVLSSHQTQLTMEQMLMVRQLNATIADKIDDTVVVRSGKGTFLIHKDGSYDVCR